MYSEPDIDDYIPSTSGFHVHFTQSFTSRTTDIAGGFAVFIAAAPGFAILSNPSTTGDEINVA